MKFNSLIPELSVSDIEESKKFYIDILGSNLEYERIEEKFAFLSLGDIQIMIEEVNGYWNTAELKHPFGRGINFQMEVESVKVIRDNLVKNNIELFRDITVSEYVCNGEIISQKEFLVQDLNGYLLMFCSK